MFKNILVVSIWCFYFVQCANILGIIPTASYSHQIPFRRLWQELSKRGHNVTVLTTDPVKDKTLTNLTEIDISSTYELLESTAPFDEMLKLNGYQFLKKIGELKKILLDYHLSDPRVLELLDPKKNTFDVILIEIIFVEYVALGRIHNCPVIGISSLDALSIMHEKMGNLVHPIAFPDFILPFHNDLSFGQRVLSVTVNYLLKYLEKYKTLSNHQRIIDTYFKDVDITPKELYDIDMMFLNVNPALHYPRAFGPQTIAIGGFNNVQEPKDLPKDIKNFLDSSSRGVIYFSLGSNMKSSKLEKEKLETIIETISELPYDVLWKFEIEMPNQPKNVKIIKWGPQQDILHHRNVKLFITQGGLQSMEEAIYYGVPMVVLPVFADQDHNAKMMEHRGIAKMVEHKPYLNKANFKNTILTVITDSSYKENIQRLAQLMMDQPLSGLEKAIWWTEYVIRNKGADQLRSPILQLPFYQYYMLDVFGLFFILMIFVFYVPYRILLKKRNP